FPEADLRGYAWYFSKGSFLNIGIGALDDGRGLHRRLEAFLDRLRRSGRLTEGLRLEPFRGHAYALRVAHPRSVAGPSHVLVGDAAGLARDISGEGIGPAVASGNLAATAVARVLAGTDGAEAAAAYRQAIARRFGSAEPGWAGRLRGWMPRSWTLRAADLVCRTAWLRRRLVFEGAFGMG
ncbi:MAG: NAD(P)/FAD-dependent oxidoreductase, partial [Candidatus Binatia bacterium]